MNDKLVHLTFQNLKKYRGYVNYEKANPAHVPTAPTIAPLATALKVEEDEDGLSVEGVVMNILFVVLGAEFWIDLVSSSASFSTVARSLPITSNTSSSSLSSLYMGRM